MSATTLDIKNETHWQTRDVGKLIRAAVKHAGLQAGLVTVTIDFASAGNTYGEIEYTSMDRTLVLNLPKRGPKDDPITMLATTAVSDEPVLAPSVVYGLARTLVTVFINRTTAKPRFLKRRQEAVRNRTSRVRPRWLPDNTYIRRYAKKKAPEKKTFVEKVEFALGRAEARVEEWEVEVEHAEAHLKRARRDLKNEQKRMRDARRRAGERGEALEHIGRGHRLYGRF